MISKFLSYKNKIFILFLFFFSIIINQHYANKGAFPQDSFFHFDAAYRILNGEHPFKDFSLEINNNLEFAPFMETTNQYPSKAPFPGLRETTGSFTIEYSDDTDYYSKSFYDYITEIKDDIKLRLSLEDGNSKFIINCDNIVFTDGGSLDSLPEGMLELNLEFTSVNKATKIRQTDETGNYGLLTPVVSENILFLNEGLTFTIREE